MVVVVVAAAAAANNKKVQICVNFALSKYQLPKL